MGPGVRRHRAVKICGRRLGPWTVPGTVPIFPGQFGQGRGRGAGMPGPAARRPPAGAPADGGKGQGRQVHPARSACRSPGRIHHQAAHPGPGIADGGQVVPTALPGSPPAGPPGSAGAPALRRLPDPGKILPGPQPGEGGQAHRPEIGVLPRRPMLPGKGPEPAGAHRGPGPRGLLWPRGPGGRWRWLPAGGAGLAMVCPLAGQGHRGEGGFQFQNGLAVLHPPDCCWDGPAAGTGLPPGQTCSTAACRAAAKFRAPAASCLLQGFPVGRGCQHPGGPGQQGGVGGLGAEHQGITPAAARTFTPPGQRIPPPTRPQGAGRANTRLAPDSRAARTRTASGRRAAPPAGSARS